MDYGEDLAQTHNTFKGTYPPKNPHKNIGGAFTGRSRVVFMFHRKMELQQSAVHNSGCKYLFSNTPPNFGRERCVWAMMYELIIAVCC